MDRLESYYLVDMYDDMSLAQGYSVHHIDPMTVYFVFRSGLKINQVFPNEVEIFCKQQFGELYYASFMEGFKARQNPDEIGMVWQGYRDGVSCGKVLEGIKNGYSSGTVS